MSNKASEVCKHLFSLNTRGIKYDLQRIEEAAKRLGNPQNCFRSIHIAGTNGKGSTCAYLESILRTSGYKTGLFTSPHIMRFEERFQINGKIISEKQWLDIYEQQSGLIDELKLTFFEATTLMAFELFKKEGVQWAVFETGMGGRLDATNIIKPAVSVITRIAMDHSEFLGDNILSVAREKIGIVKQNTPLVIASNSDASVMNLVRDVCKTKNADLTIISADSAIIRQTDEGLWIGQDDVSYDVRLSGPFQALNVLLAVAAIEKVGITDEKIIKKGLSAAVLPGRFQKYKINEKTVIFDVGHNPDAAEAFVRAVKNDFPDKRACIVTGIMKDKDMAGVLEKYLEIAEDLILTQPKIERAASPYDLLSHVPPEERKRCSIAPDIESAVAAAFKNPNDLICIAGSFYTVGEAFNTMKIEPFKLN